MHTVQEICALAKERLDEQIRIFKNLDKPLLLIAKQYPGIWLEHVYDAVFYAKMFPSKRSRSVAENTINVYLDYQKENGQLPYKIVDGAFTADGNTMVGYSQIQECVSFPALALEIYRMNGDKAFLKRIYDGSAKWEQWLRRYRMTSKRGLIEQFVGFDTGHDQSARTTGMGYPHNFDGKPANELPEDEVAPILAVDMNANFYATQIALSKMANELSDRNAAERYQMQAKEIKKKLFELCYDEQDGFFYDVDKYGKKRKYLSSATFHVLLEKVLDPIEDEKAVKRLIQHLKDPKKFWTEYPIPSMAISDPSTKNHAPSNCWGYYSQALIALRATRWMDEYGLHEEMDYLCERWLQAKTACFDAHKLGQETDPLSGAPTKCAEWYSSCMLFYLYAAKRLGFVQLDKL